MDTRIKFIKREKVFRFFEKQTEIDILSKIKNQNLLLIGSGYTGLSNFLFYYTLHLIQSNRKIIFFVDKEQSYSDYKTIFSNFEDYFKHYFPNKTLKITDEEDCFLKGKIINYDADFNIIRITEGNSNSSLIKERQLYFPDVFNDIALKETDCTIIFKDILNRQVNKKDLFFINDLNKKNINLIITDHCPRYYKDIVHFFDYFITSHVYDQYSLRDIDIYKDMYSFYYWTNFVNYEGTPIQYELNNAQEFNFIFYQHSKKEIIKNISAFFKPIKSEKKDI